LGSGKNQAFLPHQKRPPSHDAICDVFAAIDLSIAQKPRFLACVDDLEANIWCAKELVLTWCAKDSHVCPEMDIMTEPGVYPSFKVGTIVSCMETYRVAPPRRHWTFDAKVVAGFVNDARQRACHNGSWPSG
jgi:hypothetical protein